MFWFTKHEIHFPFLSFCKQKSFVISLSVHIWSSGFLSWESHTVLLLWTIVSLMFYDYLQLYIIWQGSYIKDLNAQCMKEPINNYAVVIEIDARNFIA